LGTDAEITEAGRTGLGLGLRGLTARLLLLPPSRGACSNGDFWTLLQRLDPGSMLTLEAAPGT